MNDRLIFMMGIPIFERRDLLEYHQTPRVVKMTLYNMKKVCCWGHWSHYTSRNNLAGRFANHSVSVFQHVDLVKSRMSFDI